MASFRPFPREFSGSLTGVAAATQVTCDIGTGKKEYVRLQRVQVKRSAGTAANITPSIGNTSAYTTTSVNCKMLGAITAVATLYDVTGINGWFATDDTGLFYFRPTPDAAADNALAYSIIVEVA